MPHWLNSSMHLLNGLPALNTTAFNGAGRRGSPSRGRAGASRGKKSAPPGGHRAWLHRRLGVVGGPGLRAPLFPPAHVGHAGVARAYFTDRACWMQHMRLDRETGLDPSGIKLRAVTGLEAVDWFVPGYFVWGKVIESLGDVGYDPNSIHAATFDWRPSPEQHKFKDGYFTRLKHSVETLVEIHGVPVALLAHSYGDQLVRYFLNWVETDKREGGGGGRLTGRTKTWACTWTSPEPMLGIPKTIPSLLSGEMRDTAILGRSVGVGPALRRTRFGGIVSNTLGTVASTFRTWGSLWAMLPRGGTDIWGADDALGAPDGRRARRTRHRARRRAETDRSRAEARARGVPPASRQKTRASPLRLSVRPRADGFRGFRGSGRGRRGPEGRGARGARGVPVGDERRRAAFDRVGADHPANLREYRDVILGSSAGAHPPQISLSRRRDRKGFFSKKNVSAGNGTFRETGRVGSADPLARRRAAARAGPADRCMYGVAKGKGVPTCAAPGRPAPTARMRWTRE